MNKSSPHANNWKRAFSAESAWLSKYSGNFGFYLSLQQQVQKHGYLSEKQTLAITRAIERENIRASQPQPDVAAFSLKPNEGIEIKAWLARKIAEDFKLEVAFRNLRVVSVTNETARAYECVVRYYSMIAERCHICGLELDTEISRACGIGPVCAKKLGFKRAKIEDAQFILNRIEMISDSIGDIGPRWIPKSQIVRRFDATVKRRWEKKEDSDE